MWERETQPYGLSLHSWKRSVACAMCAPSFPALSDHALALPQEALSPSKPGQRQPHGCQGAAGDRQEGQKEMPPGTGNQVVPSPLGIKSGHHCSTLSTVIGEAGRRMDGKTTRN